MDKEILNNLFNYFVYKYGIITLEDAFTIATIYFPEVSASDIDIFAKSYKNIESNFKFMMIDDMTPSIHNKCYSDNLARVLYKRQAETKFYFPKDYNEILLELENSTNPSGYLKELTDIYIEKDADITQIPIIFKNLNLGTDAVKILSMITNDIKPSDEKDAKRIADILNGLMYMTPLHVNRGNTSYLSLQSDKNKVEEITTLLTDNIQELLDQYGIDPERLMDMVNNIEAPEKEKKVLIDKIKDIIDESNKAGKA